MNLRLCVAVLLLLPPAAFAQGTQGPFGGLFGREPHRTGTEFTVFELRGASGLQWDDALLDTAEVQDQRIYAGRVATAMGTASLRRKSNRLDLELRSTADYRQTVEDRPIGGTSVDNSLTLSSKLLTRLTVNASAAYQYSPFYQFHPSFMTLPNGIVTPALPYVASVVGNHSGMIMGGITSAYSKRSRITIDAQHRETRFAGHRESNVAMSGVHGLWTRQLSRSLALRFGYGREQWTQEALPGVAYQQEEIEAGVDVHRTFSSWRQTTLTFNTQSVFLRRLNSGRRFRLNGTAALSRRFRKSWEVSLSANRQSEFMPGFIEPVFTDTVGFSLGGRFFNRVETVTLINGGRGTFGIDGELGKFATASAITQLHLAVARHFGVIGQYGYYNFDLPSGVTPIAAVNHLTRQTFMVGITTWIPVFERERGDSDTR